jgi:hypothetical protein
MSFASFLSRGWPAGTLLLLSCHDAPRTNPFDPALTPAVELRVALDDTAGTATLTWTPYEGQQPFAQYRVLRNIAERTRVDTLVHIPLVAQTTFADTTLEPNTAYVYRVEVVNSSGQGFASEEKSVAGYSAGPVSRVEVEMDGQRGEAQLRWSQYGGGRFAGYRVERRRVEEEGFGEIARLAGVQDTGYVDAGVEPGVSYFYRVVVEAAGQDWPSSPSPRQGFALAPVPLLAASPDPQEGVVRLRWGRFAGPDFEGYQLWRKAVGTDQEEKVGEVADTGDTTLVDASARAGVDYEYWVKVQAGGQELFSNTLVARLGLPRVELQPVEFRAATASAALRWSRYTGPRFQAYQVMRRTAELAPLEVAVIPDSAATTYVDRGLAGNTRYFYQVVVKTVYDEEIPSQEEQGIMHEQVGAWPLEIEEGEYARLYREGEGITALVTGQRQVRLLFFDSEGKVGDQVLLDDPFLDLAPRSAATALSEEGERILSLKSLGLDPTVLLRFAPDGQLRYQEREVFADSLPVFSGPEGVVEGEITLRIGATTSLDNVRVSRGDQVLFAEDFEDQDLEGWDNTQLPQGLDRFLVDSRFSSTRFGSLIAKRDTSWQDFRLEAELAMGSRSSNGSISIGSEGFVTGFGGHSRFRMGLLYFSQRVELSWIFSPPPNSGLKRRNRSFKYPLPLFLGLGYRLGLGFAAGQLSASVGSPVFWGAPQRSSPGPVWRCSRVGLGKSSP